jgi:hypothetical protein
VSPCSANQHRARGSKIVNQPHLQLSNRHDPTALTAATRARARGREGPDCGPHHHLSLGQGAAPSASHDGGQTEAAVATTLNMLLPPSTDGVDRMYRQLADIHAIATASLAECAHWHRSDPTSSPV